MQGSFLFRVKLLREKMLDVNKIHFILASADNVECLVQDVLEYIEHKGCCLGLTNKIEVVDSGVHSKYLLLRLDCNDFPPKSDNYLRIK